MGYGKAQAVQGNMSGHRAQIHRSLYQSSSPPYEEDKCTSKTTLPASSGSMRCGCALLRWWGGWHGVDRFEPCCEERVAALHSCRSWLINATAPAIQCDDQKRAVWETSSAGAV